VEKCYKAVQVRYDNMAHALYMLGNKGYRNTLRIRNIIGFHYNSGYTDAPQCNVIRTLAVLLKQDKKFRLYLSGSRYGPVEAFVNYVVA
jgi:hypothetical protein